jgi:ABC-type branched-subunit amino acid transport system substrate-binding protein
LTVGVINDITGVQAPLNGSTAQKVILAAIAKANDQGGVNGYHINVKTYDSQSTPAGGLTAARQAIADHDFAVLAQSIGLQGGLPTLNSAQLPTIGDGDVPAWSNAPYLFSVSGNILTQNTSAWMDVLIKEGRTKIAIPGGTLNPVATENWEKLVPYAGGQLCFGRVGIDGTNTAAITALAHEIISAGCQGVASPTMYPGTLQLQIAMNALGGNVQVVDAADGGPAVIQQAGTSANNLIFANQIASPYATADPGIQEFDATVNKYEPGTSIYCGVCEKGYAATKWFLNALSQVQGTPTQTALVNALDSTNGFTADGLVGPITEPSFHTVGTLCLSYSQIQSGKWVPLIQGSNPFLCGKRFAG